MKPILSLLFLVLLSACTSTSDLVTKLNPFKIDVRQGNYVTQEMVGQLKLGQTRDQVRFILGTPLVTDVFHVDRWDYVYRFQPGSGPVQQRRLVVFFNDKGLARVGGDVLAQDPNAVQEIKPAVSTIEIEDPTAKAAVADKKN